MKTGHLLSSSGHVLTPAAPFERKPPSSRGDVVREGTQTSHPEISLVDFVAVKFLPEYIEKKGRAGRRHYQAMLKHILRPDTVDRIFKSGASRLKAIPGWPYLDEVKLCHVREHHIRDITRTAEGLEYSTQTIRHIRNVLSVIISHAQREHLYPDENPVLHVETPPMLRKRAQHLTITQAKAMLSMMQYPEREIALLAITTGMTIQEICGLQWKHINLAPTAAKCDDRTIPPSSILVTQHWYPEGLFSLHSNRIRTVDIPRPLFLTLTRLKQETTTPIGSDSFLLEVRSGEPVRPTCLRKSLRSIGREIAMPTLSWRHINRAHSAMLSELRIQLSAELVSSAC